MDNNQEQDNSVTIHRSFLKTLSKRTEKLVTAMYMVTDCIEDNEPSKTKIRNLALDMVTLSHAIPENGPYEKGVLFGDFILLINELETIIRISGIVGIITEMNATILIGELSQMKTNAHAEQGNSFHGIGGAPVKSFVLDPNVFDTDSEQEFENHKGQINTKGHDVYKSPIQNKQVSFLKSTQLQNKLYRKGGETQSKKFDVAKKLSRRNTILKLIKDKKEVTIKDISQSILDCSEKTIQRELGSLVEQGVLKKTGEKRWSRYSIL